MIWRPFSVPESGGAPFAPRLNGRCYAVYSTVVIMPPAMW